jgi:hypothetical protein
VPRRTHRANRRGSEGRRDRRARRRGGCSGTEGCLAGQIASCLRCGEDVMEARDRAPVDVFRPQASPDRSAPRAGVTLGQVMFDPHCQPSELLRCSPQQLRRAVDAALGALANSAGLSSGRRVPRLRRLHDCGNRRRTWGVTTRLFPRTGGSHAPGCAISPTDLPSQRPVREGPAPNRS